MKGPAAPLPRLNPVHGLRLGVVACGFLTTALVTGDVVGPGVLLAPSLAVAVISLAAGPRRASAPWWVADITVLLMARALIVPSDDNEPTIGLVAGALYAGVGGGWTGVAAMAAVSWSSFAYTPVSDLAPASCAIALAVLSAAGVVGRRSWERQNALIRSAEAAHARVTSVLRVMVEEESRGVVVCDSRGWVVEHNTAAASFLGSLEVGLRCPWDALDLVDADGEHSAFALAPELAVRTGRVVRDQRVGATRADRTVRWLSLSAYPIDAEDGRWVLTQLTDVTATRQLEDLANDARVDPLTGCANRRHLGSVVADVPPDEPVAVIVCDIDGFKGLNDTYGHGVGDQVLVAIADRLRRVSRDDDCVARLGGDEFLVLLRSVDDDHLGSVVRRLVDVLGEPCDTDGGLLYVTTSVGVATGAAFDFDQVAVDADRRMYERKRTRRRGDRNQSLDRTEPTIRSTRSGQPQGLSERPGQL